MENNDSRITQKGHHAGQDGVPSDVVERPIFESDKSLREATKRYENPDGSYQIPDYDTLGDKLTPEEHELLRAHLAGTVETDSSRKKKLAIKVGAGVTAAVLFVGAVYAAENSGGSRNTTPKQLLTPVATAPAVPGGATEQQSVPAPQPVGTPETTPNRSIANFPFKETDGTVHEGLGAFAKVHELSVDKITPTYSSEEFYALMIATVTEMSNWTRSGADPETDRAYANYPGAALGRGSYAVTEFYDQAYGNALSNSTDFSTAMHADHSEYVTTYEAIISSGAPVTFSSEYRPTLLSYAASGKDVQIDMSLQQITSVPGAQEAPRSISMTLEQAPGSDGRPVWKVISYTTMVTAN